MFFCMQLWVCVCKYLCEMIIVCVDLYVYVYISIYVNFVLCKTCMTYDGISKCLFVI